MPESLESLSKLLLVLPFLDPDFEPFRTLEDSSDSLSLSDEDVNSDTPGGKLTLGAGLVLAVGGFGGRFGPLCILDESSDSLSRSEEDEKRETP